MARDDRRCLPPTRTLRRIRWPLWPRSRDRPTAFRRCDDRWTTLSRRPGSRPVLHRFSSGREGRLSSGSFAGHDPRRFRDDDRALLGPRSLASPPFLERCMRAYSRPDHCLPTSATKHDVRALSSGLSFPRGDDGHDHLPFLTYHARPLVVGANADDRSGDTRRATHSSADLDPAAGSSHSRGFARPRYQSRRATSRARAFAVTREFQ